jgi:5-methylcytosine-specific restriction enzyme A
MPTRPPRACQVSRCPNLTPGRYCSAHAQRGVEQERALDRQRGSARARGYTTAWEKARAGFLAKHPRCECPAHRGQPDAPRSTDVDHIVPHRGDQRLFWDRSNWQAMAHACHSAKTAGQDGGFGHNRAATVHKRATSPEVSTLIDTAAIVHNLSGHPPRRTGGPLSALSVKTPTWGGLV